MFELEEVRKVLDPSVQIKKGCLSYVIRLFPEFKDLSYILYKEHSPESLMSINSKLTKDDETSFDITGSPLKYSFDEGNVEDSIILVKQNWYQEEEQYLPLNRTEACNVLNACIEYVNDILPPILALCDGKDKKNSRLLGTMIEDKWFTTIEVCSSGIETFDIIKQSSSKLLKQHLALSHACEHDVTISVFSIFDLFGIKEEMINWNENVKSNYEGSLSIEVNASNLSLYSPTRTSKNKLVAQLVTGSISSSMKELWNQLLLLNEYLSIIEEYKNNTNSHYNLAPIQFPHNFTNPCAKDYDTIMKDITLLLNEDYSFKYSENTNVCMMNLIQEDNFGNSINIQQYIQNLSCRYNLDFTDFLWELLIMNSNYSDMIKCIYTIFEEVIVNGFLPQVNSTNTTRIAKIIANPPQQTVITHLLSGTLPLEYVVDIGFEKLCRDYTYVLMNARFGELDDIQQKLKSLSCTEFTLDIYRKKLLLIAQIHICLEFMLLLQDNLECPNDDLRTLFSCAFKEYVCEKSPMQNCHDLHKNIIYTLTIPLPVSTIKNLNKEVPSIRKVLLSSESHLSKLKTITYYSQLPIFPTNIYTADDSDVMDEAYHVTSAIWLSNKFK